MRALNLARNLKNRSKVRVIKHRVNPKNSNTQILHLRYNARVNVNLEYVGRNIKTSKVKKKSHSTMNTTSTINTINTMNTMSIMNTLVTTKH